MKPYKTSLKETSKTLRKNMTDAEQKLWFHLRRKQLCNTQFYRQKPLLKYIVDFYSAKAKLVIEVDGSQHLDEENKQNDFERDEALHKLGLTVLRFNNKQVLTETEEVLAVVHRHTCGNLP